jgi:hypothetical protein
MGVGDAPRDLAAPVMTDLMEAPALVTGGCDDLEASFTSLSKA